MPKQSAKKQRKRSKKEEDAPSVNLGVLLLRYMPIEMALIVGILVLSFHVRWWPLEFVVSYTPQILILLWVYLMVYATVSTWYLFVYNREGLLERVGKTALSAFAVGGVLGVYAFAYSISVTQALDISDTLSFKSDRLTIGTFNKLYVSDNFAEDAATVTAAKVDVFALQEVVPEEVKYLSEQVNHDYSYVSECNCSAGDTEIALLSRYPIRNALSVYESPNAIVARTLIDSEEFGEFVVYVVHMPVPYIIDSYNQRDDVFELLQEAMNNETLPTFAVGDFNTTVYSPDMVAFSDGLDASNNVLARSWPQCSWFGTPVGELACARIDYVFAPRISTVYSLEIGQQQNSDHRSVIAEVSF